MAADPKSELPFHLSGNYAPVEKEVEAFDLPVEGAVPPELEGLFVRNGPNPRKPTNHWFVGEGMLHGVRLEGGRASWYRNRWLRTRVFEEGATFVGEDGTVDLTVAAANTHIVRHARRILALVESSFPTEVTGELATVGCYDFGGRLTTAMTAHPKTCPVTGELHFFGYAFAPPFLTYHRVDASGALVQSEVIEGPGPSMMHDFAITEKNVIFMDLPIVFSPEDAMEGRFPYAWSDDYGARLGVMPRGGSSADVRWVEIEPCYVFHPLNAFEGEGGAVVLDVCRYPELWRGGAENFASASLHRFTIDAGAGRVRETPLDDLSTEFPRLDERRTGLPNRYGYAVGNRSEAGVSESTRLLVRYDLETGARETHDFGAGAPGEAVFAPGGPGEDEGWLLTYVFDERTEGSELQIFDASRIAAGPVARVGLPQRVPFGFHGSWLADEA